MNTGRKNNLKYRTTAILCIALFVVTSFIAPVDTPHRSFDKTLTPSEAAIFQSIIRDTVPEKKDSIVNVTDTFGVKMSKDSLDAPFTYEASDSMKMDVPNKRIILYSKGKVTYKDIVLTADSIAMDQPTNMIVATYRKDSTGKIIGLPVMLQAETKMTADVIKYNFKSQRGVTQNTFTTQGEIFMNIAKSKKITDNEYFGIEGKNDHL
ncbi:MAG: hypothetical protein IPP79_06080 [Chitinophagaceae bacterium]|nr:hypothetical protein [Chitinophagaceae bacterium]